MIDNKTLKMAEATLNIEMGYSNRYRLLGSADGTSYAIYKAEGDLDRNESGWWDAPTILVWMRGYQAGHAAAKRRHVS